MPDTFWKAKERRILRKWFGLERIGKTGRGSPDGRGPNLAIEIFTYRIPNKLIEELAQAEAELKKCEKPNEFIPWGVFGPKGGMDEDCLIYTRLKWFPRNGRRKRSLKRK
jgi:hypothetical protein